MGKDHHIRFMFPNNDNTYATGNNTTNCLETAVSELPPLIEVWASWSIFLTEQVYPSSKGRTDLDNTKII